jgi:transposase
MARTRRYGPLRYMITDGLWAAMEPLVNRAKKHRGGQPPVLPDRLFFEAVLYTARTGIPLRDLPAEFGRWDAVYNRFRRWVGSGALARLFELLTAEPQFGEVRRVLVDSTNVRAHRHAAGAARKAKHLGAAESARRQGLGRSRGGLTSKIMLTAADENTAIAVDVRPGQAHDAPLLKPMLERTAARLGEVDQVVGDKAFDGAAQRKACAAVGAAAVIPAKSNRVTPEPLDEAAYRERNRVERLFAKLKEFRRVATRYEKLKVTYLGLLHLTLGFIRLRKQRNVNTA